MLYFVRRALLCAFQQTNDFQWWSSRRFQVNIWPIFDLMETAHQWKTNSRVCEKKRSKVLWTAIRKLWAFKNLFAIHDGDDTESRVSRASVQFVAKQSTLLSKFIILLCVWSIKNSIKKFKLHFSLGRLQRRQMLRLSNGPDDVFLIKMGA